MNKILTIGQLRKAIAHLDDDDQLALETINLTTGDAQDLYPFYIDVIEGIRLENGKEIREVRFCQMSNTKMYEVLDPNGVSVFPGQVFSENEVEKAKDKFIALCKEKGYYLISLGGKEYQITLESLRENLTTKLVEDGF